MALAAAKAPPQPGQGLGWRHIQVVGMFLAACSAITMRVCLSVAVVAMTGPETGDGQQRFDWSPTEKSAVISSFLWGYICTQAVGGAISSRGRATLMLASALGTSGVLTAVLPLAAVAGGAVAVSALRVFTGIIQGVMYPSIFTLIGRWVPPDERSRSSALLFASQPMGNVLAMGLSGLLAGTWGWPAVFYAFGGCGVLVASSLCLLLADTPSSHPRISQAERSFLVKAISTGAAPQARLPVPWCAMIRSPPLLTVIVAFAGFTWGYWVIIACTPSYINNLLNVGIEWNGLVSAGPHVAMLVCSLLFGWLGDFIHARRLLSLSHNRKLLNTIGEWGASILCLLIAALGPQNPPLAVALLVVAGGVISACYAGCSICFVDISPNFSGLTFAAGNTLGSFVGAFAPYAEAFFVDHSDPMPGWSNVFYLTAAVYLLFNLVWCVWGTAEVQPWNDPGVILAVHAEDGGLDNHGFRKRLPDTQGTTTDGSSTNEN